MGAGEMWTQLGSSLAGLMFVWAMFKQYFPFQIEEHVQKYTTKLASLFYPYIQITFHEYNGEHFQRSKAYAAIQRYLSADSTDRAKRLKADMVRDSKSLVLSMDDYEEVTDESFMGIKVWWASNKNTPKPQMFTLYGDGNDDKRYYTLKFHRRDKEVVYGRYLSHVMDEGKAIEVKTRQRKLHTNNRGEQWDGFRRTMWSHVVFEHPATFDTLAMEENKKKKIMNDLITFTKSKDYYKKIGKAWKRGYLLFGPPGTGKSTMIAAMANLLEYDVYDLELTAVKDNTELRKLLIDISSKSIIVIEDIDCSLDLTGQRKKKKEKEKDEEGDGKDPVSKKKKEDQEKSNESSKVTLSGLLNFIDGLWSACGGERIIVFTTNYVEKLDPALIRRGRMDKHIELTYCCFEAFKVLARNYLDIESHNLFETIKKLLEENEITPADVAENLMPMSPEDDADTCLANLIDAIEKAKEEAKVKAEEEEKEKERAKAEEEKKAKAEKEEKEKAEKEEKDKEKEQKSDEEVKEKKTAGEEVKENGG
ncbi:AAA-ATPase At3g28580-like isoform X1 [Rhododendron vialii]|uniref:AAA-ATPase At3g28580-like isoform X1 n=1 Tax=Rhododendron vialii TaxID=182163 RepID=UPI00265E8906|nr:AAA-ATPase At3g28580-like isoform X1 [Rhododendron vialii]